jgi:hypothetical protein
VLISTGNFFIPSPTANLVGIEEGQTELIFRKKKDALLFSFASFLFSPESLQSVFSKEKFRLVRA